MTLSIGALAAAAGVSVQTLRHYDQLGLLRPSARTKAGYRQYSSDDRAKLDVIRTLRELEFDLPTIGQLLRGKKSLAEGAALQLRALEHQSRVIQRRMSVLRVFLERGDTLDPRRLKQLELLARLERQDQARFLSTELDRRMERAAPAPMREMLRRMAMIELPVSATEAQLDAWLELAELVSDPSFLAHYDGKASRRQVAPSVFVDAARASASGLDPTSPEAAAIAKRWARAIASQAGRRDYASYAREIVDAAASGRHAPEQRFWRLMAILRPEVARSPQMIAWEWLLAAARAWLGT